MFAAALAFATMPSLNVLKAARKMRQEASPRAHVRAEDFGVPALLETPSVTEPNPQLPPTVHYVPFFISREDEELLPLRVPQGESGSPLQQAQSQGSPCLELS